MIAAIYGRKSTEQHGLSDEQKSVARQVEHGAAQRPGGHTTRSAGGRAAGRC